MEQTWPDATEWSIGRRILHAREQANLTQTYVAKALGITRNAVSLWETKEGANGPKPSLLNKLPALLGCPADWLLTGAPSGTGGRVAERSPLHGYGVGADAARHAAEFQKLLDADPGVAAKFSELLEVMVASMKRSERGTRKPKGRGDDRARPDA